MKIVVCERDKGEDPAVVAKIQEIGTIASILTTGSVDADVWLDMPAPPGRLMGLRPPDRVPPEQERTWVEHRLGQESLGWSYGVPLLAYVVDDGS